MKRLTMLVVVASAAALVRCGGDDNKPSVSQVTVTVMRAGVAQAGVPVVQSTGIDRSKEPDQPTGVMATVATDASGQVAFSIPASTSTGEVCFSSLLSRTSGFSFIGQCKSLNILAATLTLEHSTP